MIQTAWLQNFLRFPWEGPVLFLFIFTLPFSIRNVLWSFSPTGSFNEYTDVSLYHSDLLLGLFCTIVLLRYKTSYKSSMFNMFRVEHHILLIAFLTWSLASIFWSENPYLALYGTLKVFEGVTLFVVLAWLLNWSPQLFHVEQRGGTLRSVPRGTYSSIGLVHSFFPLFYKIRLSIVRVCSTWNIRTWLILSFIIGGIFQAVIAIFQFIFQKSLGFHWLGESYISQEGVGIAKIAIQDQVLIRAYGLFPHPNILAIYLVLAILFVISFPYWKRMKLFHVEHGGLSLSLKIMLSLLSIALLVTFSKSGLISLILLITVLMAFFSMFHVEHQKNRPGNVPRGTNVSSLVLKKIYSFKYIWPIVILLLLITTVFQWINYQYFIIQPVKERLFLMTGMLNFTSYEYLFGLGMNQYVLLLQNLHLVPLEAWQFQPPHNLFLIILGELGVIGVLLFLGVLGSLRINIRGVFHVEHGQGDQGHVPRGTWSKIIGVLLLIIFLVPSFTDHYWWDIQQGQLLMWVILALIYSESLTSKNNIL